MTERLQLYLHQMQSAASDACEFVKGMDRGGFLGDIRTQHAVGMSLIILGEATTRIATEYPEFLNEHPDIPWQNIQGLRNRLAHGYFDVDMNIVWETVVHSLPDFLDQLHMLRNWRAQGE